MKISESEFFEALEFCGKVHKGQTRGNGDPYVFHCIRVSQIIATLNLPPDMMPLRSKLILAALFHDCIEDGKDPKAIEETMTRRWGSFVTGIVLEVTQDPKLPKKERRQKMVDECGAKSLFAQILKLADRLDNCSEMAGMSENFIQRYLTETPAMLRNMTAGCNACPSLKNRIEAIIKPMIESRFESEMKQDFVGLWKRIEAKTDGVALFDKLAELYRSRAYHNLRHIEHSLNMLTGLKGLCKQPDAVEVALWFHDAIYIPGHTENEQESAQFAVDELKAAGLSDEFAIRVKSLILATDFNMVYKTGDELIISDIDLSVLAASAAVFEAYDAGIRQEYAAVPEERYRCGRKKVLQFFLEKKTIFQTPTMAGLHEANARENIKRAIALLGQKGK